MLKQQKITLTRFQRNTISLAVSLALGTIAHAETNDEVERLITPESFVSFGVGTVSKTGQRFGQYNGLKGEGAVGLLDFSYNRRNDETGTWYRASGNNLGLNTRDFRIEHEHQGHWGYFVDYNEISRVSPYTVNTAVDGIGHNRLSVPRTATVDHQYTLKTERDRTSFGLNGLFVGNTQIRLLVQNEDKSGERLFGRGSGGAMEFLAEPIQTNTKQVDLVIDYTGDKFQLSAGYYGSFFRNENSVLGVSGGATAFNSGVGTRGVAFDNISLPPDNQAHQFHLTGGYQFDRTTRMNFKVARSVATQNEEFMPVRFYHTRNNGVSANTSGRDSLGGRLETTLANVNFTSRPTSHLSLLANLRYEERDDKTPVARYITTVGGTGASPTFSNLAGTSTTDGYNEPRSLTNRSGKLEANYTLPEGFRLTGGFDRDIKERSVAGVRVVGYREKVDEDTYRLELKRAMAESLTGSLAYLQSERSGSEYRDLVTLNGVTTNPTYGGTLTCGQVVPRAQLQVTRCGLLQPIYIADRQRQRLRFLTDWSPIEQLSTQLMIEGSSDNYGAGRGDPDIGVRQGESRLYSLDITYQASDRWKFNTWLSRTESSIDQASIASVTAMSNAGAIAWSSRQKNTVDSLGIGARGKLPLGIELGADYLYAYDKTSYNTAKENYTPFSSAATPTAIPDITYRQQTFKLFGTYPLDKNVTIRLDYILDHRKIDDWTWSNWVYSDGTRITQNPDSTVHFLGMSIRYAFR